MRHVSTWLSDVLPALRTHIALTSRSLFVQKATSVQADDVFSIPYPENGAFDLRPNEKILVDDIVDYWTLSYWALFDWTLFDSSVFFWVGIALCSSPEFWITLLLGLFSLADSFTKLGYTTLMVDTYEGELFWCCPISFRIIR